MTTSALMSPNIELSICIPTYNFGRFIEATLRSVCKAIGAKTNVEVVVLDSGSTDNTSFIVEAFKSRLPCLTYVRTNGPKGIDLDMDHVMSLARGNYCWLFSADDTMAEHAVDFMLEEISGGRDLYLCCHANADVNMRIEKSRHAVLSDGSNVEFNLSAKASAREYFARALTTEAFFSFLGGIVVRRERWESVLLDEAFVGSCWAHVARILALIPNGLQVKYLPFALLVKRGGNDSFATHGVVQRYCLAIDGYLQIARTFWSEDDYQFMAVRRVLRNEFSLRHFLFAKWRCVQDPISEDLESLKSLFNELYGGKGARAWVLSTLFYQIPVPAYVAIKVLRAYARILIGAGKPAPVSHNAR